ncbi:MAG: chromophore lyase CpcT/CpeT [Bacteroidota bacterium]
MKQIISLMLAVFISSTVTAQEKINHRDLLELKSRMEGFFTNELQAKADTNYPNVQLHIEPIWERTEDGYWLYVEEVIAPALKKPYQQNIYHLYRQDDITLVCKIFELKEASRFAGAYKNTDLLKSVTKDSLIEKKGCAVYLHKNAEGNFLGATPGKECLSSRFAVNYTTDHLTVYDNKLIIWYRGWDKDDKPVWGHRSGYQFIKQ